MGMNRLRAACVGLTLAATIATGREQYTASAAPQQAHAQVDRIFSRWTAETPGCSVGVSSRGRTVLTNAYGMADLEHAVRNTPSTIFEAGSVAKQFTAAALLLLEKDGRLSLDDHARKYVPELPDYGTPVTLKQMVQHTSGLRDWGEVAAMAGWPRTTRVHTHAHVLDIVSRQKSLNFLPGTDWSYSNTGYNLAAVIVSRVSGKSFADFTRERIFEPLGMTRTSWRDDHTRVVRDRAVAYSGAPGTFRSDMPFEKVHGNGGLLTTVEDLLRWNEHFVSPKIADAAFVRTQLERGAFSDGRTHDYAYGLLVGRYKGVPEVSHGGATAGYRAYLARYPDQHLSVALLCNATMANVAQDAHDVADVYLRDHLKPAEAPASQTISRAELDAAAGLYRHTVSGEPLTLSVGDGTLRGPGGALVALSSTRFVNAAGNQTLHVDEGGKRVRIEASSGVQSAYERIAPFTPLASQLRDYAGVFTSDEAETTIAIALDEGALVLRRRPDTMLTLSPVYADAFRTSAGLVRFHRDSSGRVIELSLVTGRVWDMRFRRREETENVPRYLQDGGRR
jgi:CubicO group peptidase (beta-lactamase class C family)